MDTFGKILAIILVVFMLYINPLQYVFESQDSVVSSFVESKGIEFIDSVCNSGGFTLQRYEQLKEELSSTGELFDIRLEHSHLVTGAETIASKESTANISFTSFDTSNSISLLQTATGHVHTDDCYLGAYGAHVHDSSCYHTVPGAYCGDWVVTSVSSSYDYSSSSRLCSVCGQYAVSFVGDPLSSYVTGRCTNCGSYSTVFPSSTSVYKQYKCSGCGDTTSWSSSYDTEEPDSHCTSNSKTLICTIQEGVYAYGDAAYGTTVCNRQMIERGNGCFRYLGYAYLDGYTYPNANQKMKPGYGLFAGVYSTRYYCSTCKKYTFVIAVAMNGLSREPEAFLQYYRVIETSDSSLNITLDESAYKKQGIICDNWSSTSTYTDIDLFFKEFDRAAGESGYISRPITGTGYKSYVQWHEDLYDEDNNYMVALNNKFTNVSDCSHMSFERGSCVCDQVIVDITPVSNTQTVKQNEAIDKRAIVTYLNGDTKTVECNSTCNTGTIADGQIATLTYSGYACAADVGNHVMTTFSYNTMINVKTAKELSSITANLSKTTIELNEAFPITSVTLKYSDNTTETVTSGWTITGFDKTKGGSQTVTISYTKNGVTKTTTKTIYVRMLASITANLSKTTVQKYSELPLTSLTLTYNNGTTETVTSGWSYTGYNPNVRGKYQVIITYQVNGVTCSTKVTITVTNLLCTCPYCGGTYYCDDSDVDNGCQDCKNKVDSLYVNPSYLILQKGEALNITVEVIYRDGHREKVTGWTSNYDPNCLGGQVVTIQYQGLRAQITVKVVARVLCPHCNNYYEYDNEADSSCPICSKQIVSITASPDNIKVNYGEELNLTVTATYRDGHTEIVYGYETTYNRFSIGIQNVTVSYNNAFTEITVEVVKTMTTCPICNREYDGSSYTSGCPFCSTEIVSIRASLINDGTKVQLGSDLILRVIVAYRDNHREAKYSGYTVEDYDKNKLGEQTVRVLYKGYSCNLLIEVVNELLKVTCPNGHVYSLNEDRSDPGCPYCVTETEDNEMSYLVVTYTDEILKKLEEDGVYQIPSGDYFTIKIKRRETSRNKNPLQSLTKIDVLYVKKEYVNGGEVK